MGFNSGFKGLMIYYPHMGTLQEAFNMQTKSLEHFDPIIIVKLLHIRLRTDQL